MPSHAACWLEGDRSVKLSQLRAMDFYPSRITKYNARHMLRSLAELVRMGGYSGLFITIDDMEILISCSSLEAVHYTKMKREDMVDLDWLASQEYSPEVIIDISKSFAYLQQNRSISPSDLEKAKEITAQARTGAIGIPKLIQMAMQEVEADV